jgi:hypothetical protein
MVPETKNEHAGEGQQQLHQPDPKTFSLMMATALIAETQNLQHSTQLIPVNRNYILHSSQRKLWTRIRVNYFIIYTTASKKKLTLSDKQDSNTTKTLSSVHNLPFSTVNVPASPRNVSVACS